MTDNSPSGGSMHGRRVFVVGASSGIGAAAAAAARRAGADVAISARRADRLEQLATSIGGACVLSGDAADPEAARAVVDGAAERLGGLDLVLYAAGFGVLQPLAECDPETWQSIYGVNVIGANLVAGAAIEHLGVGGIMAFVSSRTVEDANGLFCPYSASKAALDQCIRTWRVEHPDRRFVRIVMGNCQPTEFADHMRLELIGDALTLWERQGIPGGLMHVDDVAECLMETLAVSLDHPSIDASEIKLDARPEGPS